MRKIRTKADADRKMKRNNLIVGIVLVGLLVLSTAGYSLISSDEEDSDGVSEFGVDFYRSNNMWAAEIGGGVFWFQNLPSEVSDIDVNISIGLGDYANQPLYFVNPNEGASEILNNFGNYVLRYQEACLVNSSCDGDLPAKGCDSNLIIFESGDSNIVYQNESCVFIVGDAVRATDAFLYNVLGVN
ncbi:hypothetical protein HN935_01805 [archaeon]|jgi:hypothetical protein|nr:hypothetical protein [archaeon]